MEVIMIRCGWSWRCEGLVNRGDELGDEFVVEGGLGGVEFEEVELVVYGEEVVDAVGGGVESGA